MINWKRITLTSTYLSWFFVTSAQRIDVALYPVYTGNDLGLTYSPERSSFRIYAPTAKQVQLLLYTEGSGGSPLTTLELNKAEQGTWTTSLTGDRVGIFYTFRANIDGKWMAEVPDPYATCVGVNGKRAMIVNLEATNPSGWKQDRSPAFAHATDAILYELHVRDASIHASSGIQKKGKFIGLTESKTKSPQGLSTGLDHLKELGITHVHLLPSYDYNSVDESKPEVPQFNWGYDPLNYNVPEGSYATNAKDGVTRIREFKQLIKTFHENGLRIVMDVVYNHTALTQDSYFNQLVPGYYYRQTNDGGFSNGTACGNETASERQMMRKFMLESLKYWVEEYHVDGFRFDLMGVHDIETMNIISEELHKIKPDILLYGEGWTAGPVQLSEDKQALKKNAARLTDIAVFSDDIRDGIKGSVFDHAERGFASGLAGMEETIKFGVVAACQHPQLDYTKIKYAKAPFATQPHHTVTYCECHDNHVLWDKLAISMPDAPEEDRMNMHQLALSIVLTSQGISFLHAGTEFLRSKKGVENSYNAPDSINAIDWSLKEKNIKVFNYVKALIKMRKEHPAFRMTDAKQLSTNIQFDKTSTPGVVSYGINGAALGDSWKKIWVGYNGSAGQQTVTLPAGNWQVFAKDNEVQKGKTKKVSVLKPYSCTILYQQ
ncbi:MAG: type I pullulanase [Cyclobacteriaceae bacterium]|nr:type I pullulanase [Cyclobacteriaceae bacterium]